MTSYYIALELPLKIKQQIKRICIGLPSTDWLEEDSYYLIVLSLGNLDGSDILDVKEQLNQLILKQFPLLLSSCRFVSFKKGHGGYIRLHPEFSSELEQLSNTIRKALASIKLPDLKQDLAVILGQYAHMQPQKMANYLEMMQFFKTEEFMTGALHLIASHQTSKRQFFTSLFKRTKRT